MEEILLKQLKFLQRLMLQRSKSRQKEKSNCRRICKRKRKADAGNDAEWRRARTVCGLISGIDQNNITQGSFIKLLEEHKAFKNALCFFIYSLPI
jgi:hypothetical protein